MCVIAIKPVGAPNFDTDTLKNCWNSNDDGAGFAWYDTARDLWCVSKGYMKWENFRTAFNEMNFDDDDYVVCHFRIGTSGLKDGGNTHPFPITANLEDMRALKGEYAGIAVHNGVVGRGEGNYSDSMVHIKEWLVPLYPHIHEEGIPKIIQEVMCKGTSKWFITHGKDVYLLGTFVDHPNKKWKFSNTSYEKRSWGASYYDSGYDSDGKWGTSYNNPRSVGVWHNGKYGYWVGATFTEYATAAFDRLTPGSNTWKQVWLNNPHLQPVMLQYMRDWEKKNKVENDFKDVDADRDPINKTINWEKYKKRHAKKHSKSTRNHYLGGVKENGAIVWAPRSKEQMSFAVGKFIVCPECFEDLKLFDYVTALESKMAREGKSISKEERDCAENHTICFNCHVVFDDFTGAVIAKNCDLTSPYKEKPKSMEEVAKTVESDLRSDETLYNCG